MMKHTKTLRAIDEAGNSCEVHRYQRVIVSTDMRRGRVETLSRLGELQTADGEPLDTQDEINFVGRSTGRKFRLAD